MLNYTQEAPKKDPWVRVGSGFAAKSGKGFNLVIGNKVRKERGSEELVETVESLTLQPDDELYLSEVTNRDGVLVKTKNGAQVYQLQLKPKREEKENA